MLRSYMGVDGDGTLKQDMYMVFQEWLATPEAKEDFKMKIDGLMIKLQRLGGSSESLLEPIRVML